MSNIDTQKELYLNIIEQLLAESFVQANQEKVVELENLQKDIETDIISVIVLGEFKRGKSTFVNALIEEDLLPADVLPTTATINALMYSDQRQAALLKTDGTVVEGQATTEFLKNYIAGNNVDDVRYIKIGLKKDILDNKVVLIDTPGVSDINEQRVQVTYDFIPRANVIIFLLDAISPLKKTEKEFIDAHLVPLGINKILFVVNKFDEIDEDEESDVLDDIKKRLNSAFKMNTDQAVFKELTIKPLSSIWALKGALENNPCLIEQSGMPSIKKHVKDMALNGTVTTDKMLQFKARLTNVLSAMERSVQSDINIKNTDNTKLHELIDYLDNLLKESTENSKQISHYINEERTNLLAMTDKSLVYFHSRLNEEIMDDIKAYKGADFKEFIEYKIVNVVKKNIERWIYAHLQNIDLFMQKLDREIAKGLSRYFNQSIKKAAIHGGNINASSLNFSIEVEDISKTTIKAGLITAGGAGLILLAGGPILLPFVSMGAYPFLQRRMLEEKLREVKEQVTPIIYNQLIDTMKNLQDQVYEYIDKQINEIQYNCENTYNQLIHSFQAKLQEQIDTNETNKAGIQEQIADMQMFLSKIQTIKIQIEKEAAK